MAALGLFMLGAFIGFVVVYGLRAVTDWSNLGKVLTAVISAAVAGGVFTFIQRIGGSTLGDSLFYYPLGLAYGALCIQLTWITSSASGNNSYRNLHILGFAIASILVLALFLSPSLRSRLPMSSDSATTDASSSEAKSK
jgi:hypothetical protein